MPISQGANGGYTGLGGAFCIFLSQLCREACTATPTERRGDKFCVPNLGPLQSKWALLRSSSGSRPTMRSRSPRALAVGEASSWAHGDRRSSTGKPTRCRSDDLRGSCSILQLECGHNVPGDSEPKRGLRHAPR